MKRWSIRLRLTAWYCCVLVVALALFGTGMWLAVRHSLLSELDQTLQQHVDGAAALIQMEAAENATTHELREELAEYVKAVPEGNLMQIQDARGVPLLAAGAQESPGVDYRRHRKTITARGQRYQVYAAASLQEVDAVLRRFGILLVTAIPVLLGIASIGGYWISRRALAPVDEITEAVRTIGIRNLSQRLAVPRTGDEIQRLSETWNETLERLDAAVKRLSQFTADASHELRTPIALIRTGAELALRRERSPEAYRDALRQIQNESERTTQLVEDLLMLARADTGLQALPLNRLDLSALVQEVCDSCQILAEQRTIRLQYGGAHERIFVEGNGPALRRMLHALIDNGLKYTPAGGLVQIALSENGAGPVVTVRDTGSGIPDSALPHIFERFYRADESRNHLGGSGLGLSIAQWIAQRHRAEIVARSSPGGGSLFSVHFSRVSASGACDNGGKVLWAGNGQLAQEAASMVFEEFSL